MTTKSNAALSEPLHGHFEEHGLTRFDEPEDYSSDYTITELEPIKMAKFGLTTLVFTLAFRERENLRDVDALLRAGFSDLMERAQVDRCPHERIGMILWRRDREFSYEAYCIPIVSDPSKFDVEEVIAGVREQMKLWGDNILNNANFLVHASRIISQKPRKCNCLAVTCITCKKSAYPDCCIMKEMEKQTTRTRIVTREEIQEERKKEKESM